MLKGKDVQLTDRVHARIILEGEGYGLGSRLTAEDDYVEFYIPAGKRAVGRVFENDYMINRYNVDTILDVKGGLMLEDGSPGISLDKGIMQDVVKWLKKEAK